MMPGQGPHRRPSILIVENEASVAECIARALRPECDVEVTATGADALAALRSGAFDAVVSNTMLPDITGPELVATVIRERRIDARSCGFVAGGAPPETCEAVANSGAPVLHKPFTLDELRRFVRRLVTIGERGVVNRAALLPYDEP
jgi:DNA-binding response OmpR family regulator